MQYKYLFLSRPKNITMHIPYPSQYLHHNYPVSFLLLLLRLLLLLLLRHVLHKIAAKRKQRRVDRAPSEQDSEIETYPRVQIEEGRAGGFDDYVRSM